MSKILLSEELLKDAVKKACETENAVYDKMIVDEEEYVFSDELKKNIIELSKKEDSTKDAGIISYSAGRLSKKSLRFKIVLVAVIIMLLGSMTVVAVGPIRAKVYKMVEKFFSGYTDVTFEEVEEETEKSEIDSESRTFNPVDFPKRINWIPEGYTLFKEDVVEEVYFIAQVYQEDPAKPIIYQQMALEYSTGWNISSDGTTAKEILIGDEKGKLISDEYGYHSIVLEKEGFAYYIGGKVEVEVLIKCLQSVFEKE